jgi:TonB family protein
MMIRLIVFLASAVALSAASASRLINVSVRSSAGSGSDTLIVGFVVGGVGTKEIVLRGVGPSLIPLGVENVVGDPQLRLYSGQNVIDQNDDWGGGELLTNRFESLGAFALPDRSKDAALVKSLLPGPYTAHLISANEPAIALVEAYDAGGGQTSSFFTNVSARSRTGPGADVLTVGFVITGEGATTVMVRAVGPSLSTQGVSNVLPRPGLRLFNATGAIIGHNTGWYSDVTPPELFNAVGAFNLPVGSRDAVLFFALPAGAYTAQVSGLEVARGTALVEVYTVGNSPVPFVTMRPVTATPPEAPFDPGAGASSFGADLLPAVKFLSQPEYPFELRRASITGEALVEFFVLADGTVANPVAIRATDVRLAEVSVEAIRKWIFEPGRRDGKTMTTRFQQPVQFSLLEE